MSDDDEVTAALDDEEEVEIITAKKVLTILETAWRNELCAPDLLQHQTDMVELMLSQASHMEENMKELDKNDFRYVVHQMELERIRYVMASYLRCRLQKIETYARYILMEDEKRPLANKRLSEEEEKFAREYLENSEEYFHKVALQYMPNPQRAENDQRIVQPNLMSHVFIKAIESVPAVVVGVEDEEVDLTAGSQHIIPYQLVADLIEKNKAELI